MIRHIILLFTVLSLFSCKKPAEKPAEAIQPEGSYFSIIQFAKDQWDTYRNQPYSLEKVVTMNGKTDTTYLSALNMDWGSILKVFFDTDISDKKYLDRYNFSLFEDDATLTRNFYYEAKEQDLFTRKLQIAADEETNKIRSIYIETSKNGTLNDLNQKLYYVPQKLIQIQEFEKSKTGPDKDIRIEYRFQ